MTSSRLVGYLVVLLLGWVGLSSTATAQPTRQALKVCADPNSLPLSHRDMTGFENEIAKLFAAKLELPLEMTWFPQRRGFVRKTLRERDPTSGQYLCDLIMGVPTSFELAITTEPYYRSTYAMVFRADGPLADLEDPEDLFALSETERSALRIGVFEQSPAAVWLAQHGMIRQIVPYITLNADPDAYPGQVIEQELLSNTIDAAILWGPIAGYFVAKSQEVQGVDLKLLPMRSQAGLRFDFPISMAVRFGERDWKDQIQSLIDENQAEIEKILHDFHIPLLDREGTSDSASE